MQRFLATHYRPDLALLDPAVFRWQYGADAVEANVACAWDGPRLVGTMGYVALPAFWGSTDRPVEMAWLANWMVDPAYRQGVGVALLRAMQDRFPVLAAFGATAENERLVSVLGWAVYSHVPRWIAILDPAAAAALALPDVDPRALAGAVVAPSGRDVAVRDPIDDAVDCEWPQYATCRYGTIRSRAYLAWRYRQHPVFDYRVLAAGRPGRAAVGVMRLEDASGTATRVLRIVEFFHPDDAEGRRDAAAVIDALVQRARAAGCAFAEWVGAHAAINQSFERAGWTREVPGAEWLSGRFRPPERRAFAHNLEIGVASGYEQPPLAALCVSRGNGDADRAGSIGEVPAPAGPPG